MKKILILLLVCSMVVSFVGCGKIGKFYYCNNPSSGMQSSSVLTVEFPKKIDVGTDLNMTVGIGYISFGAIERSNILNLFTVAGEGLIINEKKDDYSMFFDITEVEYVCNDQDMPRHFQTVTISFDQNVKKGIIFVYLVSVYKTRYSEGGILSICYTIENGKISFERSFDSHHNVPIFRSLI